MTGYEMRTRTAVRSLIWRIFGILLTILLAIALGGSIKLAVELGIAYNVIRLITHYFHDRAWAHIKWGITTPPQEPVYRFKPDHLFPGEPVWCDGGCEYPLGIDNRSGP